MHPATSRHQDGSAGDANYGAIGRNYSRFRRPDHRIADLIEHALGSARTVLNVGAGAGSYEPTTRIVTAVEPSASMRNQRLIRLPAAIDAVAEKLPFADASFDASMSTFSVHQWHDLGAGLRELRRAEARLACSAWSFVEQPVVDRFEGELACDLESGRWDKQYGELRTKPFFEGSLKLVVGRV